MNASASLLPALLLIFAVALIVAGWAAWQAQRRWGGAGLLGAWAAGTVLLAALMAWRIDQQQAALGFSEAQRAAFSPFRLFAPMWAVALGAQALVLWRARTVPARPGRFGALAWRTLLAGFGGMLLFLLVYVVFDVAGLLS